MKHRPRSRHAARAARPSAPSPAPPPTRPALLAVALVAAGCVVLSVSFRLLEPDFWQHLIVGKAIWQLHRVPTTQLWSWPTHGAPDVNYAWGFEALIWPLWHLRGVEGLFAWRWATTLAVFGLAWVTARRMGAVGFTPWIVIVLCSLVYRQRSMIRPETLVAVLLMLEIWILETRRRGGPDRSPWLIAIVVVWVNVHLSFTLAFVVLGSYFVGERWGGASRGAGSATRPRALRLEWIALAAAAATLLNPFGWHALSLPFEFFTHQRQELLYRDVSELKPLTLQYNVLNGVPLLLAAWPVLLVWRAARAGLDRVEALLCAIFVALPFVAERFIGLTAIVAAPFLARDLDEWVRARRWPSWTRPAWTRAALAAATCVLMGLPEWSRVDLPLGVAIQYDEYPVVACDFMTRHGIRGRGFNPYDLGGYLLYRFWPDPTRLPFMDIHQAGTLEDRNLVALAATDPAAWRALDRRYQFDYAVMRRMPRKSDRLLDAVEGDTTMALVFMDDAAALFVRRAGRYSSLAESSGYRLIGAGNEKLGRLNEPVQFDPRVRALAIAESQREADGSRFNCQALTRLGQLTLLAGDTARSSASFRGAIAANPRALHAHEWLAAIARAQGRMDEAYRELRAEPKVP